MRANRRNCSERAGIAFNARVNAALLLPREEDRDESFFSLIGNFVDEFTMLIRPRMARVSANGTHAIIAETRQKLCRHASRKCNMQFFDITRSVL